MKPSKLQAITWFMFALLIGFAYLFFVTISQETSRATYEVRTFNEPEVLQVSDIIYIPEPEPIVAEAEINPKDLVEDTSYHPKPWDSLQVEAADMLQGRPLLDYTDVIAQACYESGMDVYWFCTIAIHESGGGEHCFKPYNAWGWMASLGTNSSWEETIPTFCHKFYSIYGSGLDESDHLMYDPNGSYSIYF